MKNLLTIFCLAIFQIGVVNKLFAIEIGGFHPSLTMGVGNSVAFQHVSDRSNDNLLHFKNVQFSYSFSFSNKFYLNSSCFLQLGLRYQEYNYKLSAGGNDVNYSYDMLWGRNYMALSIPIWFGKDFTFCEHSASVVVGTSIGRLLDDGFSSEANFYVNTTTPVVITGESLPVEVPSSFYWTVDVGGSVTPFNSLKRFSFGLYSSFHFTKSKSAYYYGSYSNPGAGKQESFSLATKQNFLSFLFAVSYKFGGKL